MIESPTKLLNDYLASIVNTSSHCAHCIFNHNGICFLAYECIKNEYSMYTEEDEEEEEND